MTKTRVITASRIMCSAVFALILITGQVTPAIAELIFNWSFTDNNGNTNAGGATNGTVSGTVTFNSSVAGQTINDQQAIGFTVDVIPTGTPTTLQLIDGFSLGTNLLPIATVITDNSWDFVAGAITTPDFEIKGSSFLTNRFVLKLNNSLVGEGVVPTDRILLGTTTATFSPVPEPSSLICFSLIVLLGSSRRFRSAQRE